VHSGAPPSEAGASRQPSTADIVYLASIDFPHAKARAVQIISTCHALARAGCHVTLVVGRREVGLLGEHLARYGLAPHARLQVIGVPAFRVPPSAPALLRQWYTRFWNWSYLAACLLLLPLLLRGSSIILVRDYRLAWLIVKLRCWRATRIAFEAHGLPSAELLDNARPAPAVGREADRRRRFEQVVFDGAWRVLTITDCLRQRLIDDYAISPHKVFTVPDACRVPTPGHKARTTDHADVGLHGPSPIIHHPRKLIYVGQLYPWKGVDLILRALVHVPRAELIIVGGLPDDCQQARLKDLGKELGIDERVCFCGPRPYEQVPGLLATADVALLPLAEGLVARCFTSPLKLFDYLAAGLPIVASDFPSVREVLRDGHNALLVPPDNATAMGAAINRLLDQPELAARLGSRARRDAANHTWDRRAERILSAFAGQRP
jgi:glycosyltransferase involved in cell wall biosynthesis